MEIKKMSSKALNILSFSTLLSPDGNNSEYQIAFLTNGGIVVGDIEVKIKKLIQEHLSSSDPDIKEITKISSENGIPIIHLVGVLKASTIKENQLEIIGDGAFFILTNVKIYNPSLDNLILQTDLLYLHSEDVVGFFPIYRDLNKLKTY
jgi:hypothetical protein